jgi:hypothetical protein
MVAWLLGAVPEAGRVERNKVRRANSHRRVCTSGRCTSGSCTSGSFECARITLCRTVIRHSLWRAERGTSIARPRFTAAFQRRIPTITMCVGQYSWCASVRIACHVPVLLLGQLLNTGYLEAAAQGHLNVMIGFVRDKESTWDPHWRRKNAVGVSVSVRANSHGSRNVVVCCTEAARQHVTASCSHKWPRRGCDVAS